MLGATLPPPRSEKRKQWVMKTILRRGAAQAQLADWASAVADYSVAMGRCHQRGTQVRVEQATHVHGGTKTGDAAWLHGNCASYSRGLSYMDSVKRDLM